MLPGRFTLFTNELRMGLHAEAAVGRILTDSQGWTNQCVADWGDAVTLMVRGYWPNQVIFVAHLPDPKSRVQV